MWRFPKSLRGYPQIIQVTLWHFNIAQLLKIAIDRSRLFPLEMVDLYIYSYVNIYQRVTISSNPMTPSFSHGFPMVSGSIETHDLQVVLKPMRTLGSCTSRGAVNMPCPMSKGCVQCGAL